MFNLNLKKGKTYLCFLVLAGGIFNVLTAQALKKTIKNGLYGFENQNGKIVIPHKYTQAKDFTEGLAAVGIGGKYKNKFVFDGAKWGFIDTLGKEVIAFKYDNAFSFVNGIACIKVKNGFGFINASGAELVPPRFDKAEIKGEKLIGYSKDSTVCYSFSGIRISCSDASVNSFVTSEEEKTELERMRKAEAEKKMLEAMKWEKAASEKRLKQEGLKKVQVENKYGFSDLNGNMVVKPEFDDCSEFANGFAMVMKGNKWSFINKSGKLLAPFKYMEVTPFSESLASVKYNNKWGHIDTTGKECGIAEYDVAYKFHEKVAIVVKNGKTGVIDVRGKLLVPAKYDHVEYSPNGPSIVGNGAKWVGAEQGHLHGGKWGMVYMGKEILPLNYEMIYPFSEGLACVVSGGKCEEYNEKDKIGSRFIKNGKWGFVDTTGKVVIPVKFDEVFSDENLNYGFVSGRVKVRSGNKIYYIDKTGQEVK